MRTYSPKDHVITFGGTRLTGLAEDDFVTIKPLGEGMQLYVGADGEASRSDDPNNCFEVTVNLASTSESNVYLSNMYNLDKSTHKGVLPLQIKDLSGSTMFFASEAFIKNFPEAGRGKAIKEQSWIFNTGAVTDPIFGGND